MMSLSQKCFFKLLICRSDRRRLCGESPSFFEKSFPYFWDYCYFLISNPKATMNLSVERAVLRS